MCGLLLSADMEFCCPSAWSCLSAYMEYEVSAVKYRNFRKRDRFSFA